MKKGVFLDDPWEPALELGMFSADQNDCFRVDSFNESGVLQGKPVKYIHWENYG